MPRTRATEVPQRPSPTGPTPRGPRNLRTSSSDSDPLHRPLTDCSPRIGDRRSLRGTQSDPANQKKLGTRITDLETQLVQAQHELKSLKYQLSSAEIAKKQAQEALTTKGIKKPSVTRRVLKREKPRTVAEIKESNPRDHSVNEVPEDTHPETDVFEVPVEKMLIESKGVLDHCPVDDKKETQSLDSAISEPEKPSSCDEVASKPSSCDVSSKDEEIKQLQAIAEEKERENQMVIGENQTLKQQLQEAKSEIASAQCKEEEMASKLNQVGQELQVSKESEAQLKQKLVEFEAAKESLETEMKKMKVQTEQWRKAADAAAAVLAGGVEMNGRISERCVSMDKHFNGIFEPPINGYGGYIGSPGAGDDIDDGFAGGKKKGSGIRMLGDLWKKKGQR